MTLPRQDASFDAVEAATPTPFPARTKQAAGIVSGVRTEVTSVHFTDKILLTISQEGRLAQWVSFSSRLRLSHFAFADSGLLLDTCTPHKPRPPCL